MVNTKDILIAQRYSDALASIAKEGKLTYDKISTDIGLIESTLSQSKDLNDFLINPLISVDDKKEVLDKVFSSEIDVLVLNLLKLLVDKNRFNIFNEIISSYKKLLDDINNISRINVVSAVEMSEESKNKLKIKLEEKLKKNVILDLSIDEAIIAGLVIKIGDNIIDMSLKHKLEDLSKSITK